MKNKILAGALVALSVLLIGAAVVQSAEETGVAISGANFEATSPEKENLNEEWVEISNLGTADASLAGWTLEDGQNHTYSFPEFSLAAGAKVKVHTGIGDDTAEDLFWNRSSAVWNNDGDTATLRDADGNAVSSYPEEAGTA